MWNSRSTAIALFTLLLLSITSLANAADSDSDGIPDEVENSYAFLNANDNSDAYLDHDGDGIDNITEYANGTSLVDGPAIAAVNQNTHLVIQVNGITVVLPLGPVVNQLSASPASVIHDQTTVLSWKVDNADYVDISPNLGRGGATDSASVKPAQSTTYTLTASGPRGTSIRTLRVNIDTDHDGAPDEIDSDDDNDGISDPLENTYGLNQYNASDAAGDLDGDGISNLIEAQHGWNLAGGNLGGVTAGSTTSNGNFYPIMMDDITLILPMAPVLVNFTASPAVISHNGSSTLSWHINEADYVELSPDLGTTTGSGSIVVTPTVSTTYTLKAFGAGGDYVTTVTVTIDTDRDGSADETDTDDDGDGIPDSAEIAMGLNPYDPADAGADPDGDGFSNLEEYLAGSDHTVNEDVPALQIKSFTATPTLLKTPGGAVQLQWSIQGLDRIYLVSETPSLQTIMALDNGQVVAYQYDDPLHTNSPVIITNVPDVDLSAHGSAIFHPAETTYYKLYAYGPNTGAYSVLKVSIDPSIAPTNWPANLDDYSPFISQSVTVRDDGSRYVGATDYNYYKYDEAGVQQWRLDNIGVVKSKASLFSDGIIVGSKGVGAIAGQVLAVEDVDANGDGFGDLLWTFNTDSDVLASPVVNKVGTVVYVVTYSGFIYALDADDGHELWHYALPENELVVATPVLKEGGVLVQEEGDSLIVQTVKKAVYALDISNVLTNEDRIRWVKTIH